MVHDQHNKENIMNDHIDQLKEWWENAEVPTPTSLPRDGDRIIIRYNSEWYEIATADGDAEEDDLSANTRILFRAPKPEPAWHDAVAVIAHHEMRSTRQIWWRISDSDRWQGSTGDEAETLDLIDPTPLIEAKVTDEMVNRGAQAVTLGGVHYLRPYEVRKVLTAALGIEERS